MRLRPLHLLVERASGPALCSCFLVLGAGATVIALVVPLGVSCALQVVLATLYCWVLAATLTAAHLYWYWLRTRRDALAPEAVRQVTAMRIEQGHYPCRMAERKETSSISAASPTTARFNTTLTVNPPRLRHNPIRLQRGSGCAFAEAIIQPPGASLIAAVRPKEFREKWRHPG